jgi:hypothetical protein
MSINRSKINIDTSKRSRHYQNSKIIIVLFEKIIDGLSEKLIFFDMMRDSMNEQSNVSKFH